MPAAAANGPRRGGRAKMLAWEKVMCADVEHYSICITSPPRPPVGPRSRSNSKTAAEDKEGKEGRREEVRWPSITRAPHRGSWDSDASIQSIFPNADLIVNLEWHGKFSNSGRISW